MNTFSFMIRLKISILDTVYDHHIELNYLATKKKTYEKLLVHVPVKDIIITRTLTILMRVKSHQNNQ